MEKFVLGNDDVVRTQEGLNFGLTSTFIAREILNKARAWMMDGKDSGYPYAVWMTEHGINCQVLLARGGGWQKGRVRMVIEFIPDETPAKTINSDLDDLREKLNIE